LEQKADLVIGQPDLLRASVNYPSGDVLALSNTGLNLPTGLAVDADGNLLVADTGNGRVVRFPAPFNQASGASQRANLVLGQVALNAPPVKDAGIANLSAPYGLALLANGSLAVSDLTHNRVVIYRRPAGGDFANYQNGLIVLGQQDFISTTAGSSASQMRNPRHIAVDSSDRLYVIDSGNNRMMVYTSVGSSTNGATSAFQLGGLNSPRGVAVSPNTGEIWVTNTNSNQVLRFAEFVQLQLNPNTQPSRVEIAVPLALALDNFDNLIVVEAINRVTFFYAKAVSQHAASYNLRALAPGQLAYLYRLGLPFAFTPADGTGSNPWPTTLGDLNLTVNGIPAPMFRVNAERIDFQVPMSAPSSGPADVVVTRVSSGEIIAAVTVVMARSNPGFFTSNAAGPANPASRGKIISFFLTGQGFVDGAPPDGAAPTGPVHTAVKPIVISPSVGTVNPSFVEYSGLGAFAGGWQINFRIPEAIPPGNNNVLVVTLNDVQSNLGPTGNLIQVIYAVR
jgi:uncharacterized protein (TIGR03437 family)